MISLKDVYATVRRLARMATAALASRQNMYIYCLKIQFRLQPIAYTTVKERASFGYKS